MKKNIYLHERKFFFHEDKLFVDVLLYRREIILAYSRS